MGDSSAGEGPSNIKTLETLIDVTKKKFHELHPNDKRWPCPFSICKTQTMIKCRIHVMKEYPSIYNANEQEFSFFMDKDTLCISESDSISFVNETEILSNTQEEPQSENNTTERNSLQCDFCSRTFNTFRGTKMHSNKCKYRSQSTDDSQSHPLDNIENLKKCPHCPKSSKNLYNGKKYCFHRK